MLLCCLFIGLAMLNINQLIFPLPPATPPVGNCQLTAGDAVLDALYLEGKDGMPVILFSHGNYQTLADIKPFCEEFRKHGYSIMAYDYAGYGSSTGAPSELQASLDIEAVHDWLLREKGVKPEDIVIMGYSVGGGPSCHLASQRPAKAVVLCAPFASAVRVVLPFSLPGDKFHNDRKLSKTDTPVLIFHGKQDHVIPFRNAERLYKKAKSTKKKLFAHDTADHNDLFDCLGDDFWTELADFLDNN